MSDGIFLQQFGLIHKQLADIRAEGSERGRRLWEQMDDIKQQSAVMEHRLAELERAMSGQSEALGKYRRLEHQAEGAGWLGRKLLAIGGVLLTGAASAYAAWDSIVAFLARILPR